METTIYPKEQLMLTYEDLAASPSRVDLPSPNYNHDVQSGSGIQMVTFNGTRTYDFKGQPNDSDQD